MKKKLLFYLGFLAYSILQTAIIFAQVPKDKFLFIGDQFIRFTQNETFRNAFYIRKLENFGVFNAWQLTIQTPDIIFYSIIYKLGIDIRTAEQLLFALIIFLTLALSFIGFNHLQKLLFSNQNIWIVLVVTIWYSINPYLMVMWHGAIYNLGSALTYSLAPLILYYFHVSVFNPKAKVERLICALLMFIASFTFWMFAAVIFFLIIYTSLYLLFNKHLLTTFFINLAKLAAIYVPLCAVIIYPILHEYFNNQGDVNGTFYATFGQIKGSLLYQALMYFSWGIYNFWTPRSIYPPDITTFYFSPAYIIATITIYAILGAGIYNLYKKEENKSTQFLIKKHHYILIYVFILFASLFLAKGQEPPFGWIFLFLYNHVPFFSVFRSSDHRFGFPAILAISVLFLILIHKIPKQKAILGGLLVVVFIQNFIFFTGKLVIGQNKDAEFYDRVVNIPNTYTEVANFFNSDSETTYAFSYPSVEFGSFNLGDGEVHIGQDMLHKISNTHFAYIPVTSGMKISTAQILVSSITNENLDLLKLLPIKYLLIRNDATCQECPVINEAVIASKADQVFENTAFKIYEINDHTPIVNSTTSITYKVINPVKFEAEIKNVTDSAVINLMQSANPNWNIYLNKYSALCTDPIEINSITSECQKELKPIDLSTLAISGDKLSARVYPQNLQHINSWSINTQGITSKFDENYYRQNSDGSYNFKVTLFYTPQRNYMWAMLVTTATIIFTLGYIMWIKLKEKQ